MSRAFKVPNLYVFIENLPMVRTIVIKPSVQKFYSEFTAVYYLTDNILS